MVKQDMMDRKKEAVKNQRKNIRILQSFSGVSFAKAGNECRRYRVFQGFV
jgi:hypothetical protein